MSDPPVQDGSWWSTRGEPALSVVTKVGGAITTCGLAVGTLYAAYKYVLLPYALYVWLGAYTLYLVDEFWIAIERPDYERHWLVPYFAALSCAYLTFVLVGLMVAVSVNMDLYMLENDLAIHKAIHVVADPEEPEPVGYDGASQ